MKELTTRLTSKGQVTVPAEIRRLLALAPRDRVSFTVDEDGMRLSRVASVAARTAGVLRARRKPRTAEDLRRIAEEAIAREAVARASK